MEQPSPAKNRAQAPLAVSHWIKRCRDQQVLLTDGAVKPGGRIIRKILMTAAALAFLTASALAQYGGGQKAGAGSQMRQSAGDERIATTGSTTKKQKVKGRRRGMNTISGNCWDAANPAGQNYRGRPHLR